MPADILVGQLGDPEDVERLRSGLVDLLKDYPDSKVKVLASASNTIWETTVKGPDGRSEWVYKSHDLSVGTVLIEVRRIVDGWRSTTSS